MSLISFTNISDGTTIDAADVNNPLNTIYNDYNGNIDGNNLADDLTVSNLTVSGNLTVGGQTPSADWTPIATAPDTVTYNGQRSYSLVFNSVDYTNILSPGQRIRTTRTVAAPTQCTALNGTNQYWNKTSPNKLTFTDDFTVMAWVKLSSYSSGGIISRINAAGSQGFEFRTETTGQISLLGFNTSIEGYTTYQSLPLNKWVHVAATLDLSGNAGTIYIDGVLVPSFAYAGGGAGAITAIVQAGDLNIGASRSGTNLYFPGKVGQAAIFDAVLNAATVRSYFSQGLSGSETNLKSAYSFNGVATDLNTTTPNDLTAQGSATATNADSPFGTQASGLISSTLDYGIVQSATFSTNTTVVVQVPEGCTIPTSGGVSAVAYSGLATPYGFPKQENRWTIESTFKTLGIVSSPVAGTWYNLTPTSGTYGGMVITIPIGNWKTEYNTGVKGINNTNYGEVFATISNANNTESDAEMTTYMKATSAATGSMAIQLYKSKTINYTAQAAYYFNVKTAVASATSLSIPGDLTPTILAIKNGYL